MENTITISVQDDFLENRAHGDTAFPCAAYFTDAKTHDIRWHWHEEYEVSIVRSGSCPLSVGTDHLVLHAGDGIFINTGTLHSQETTKATSDFYKEDLVFHGQWWWHLQSVLKFLFPMGWMYAGECKAENVRK